MTSGRDDRRDLAALARSFLQAWQAEYLSGWAARQQTATSNTDAASEDEQTTSKQQAREEEDHA